MKYDVVVIGGGQAGLAAGYYLEKTNKKYVILDAQNQAGDSWRERYDSLVLFTPRFYSSLPGLPLKGDPNGYPNKDEIADYLFQYKKQFTLRVIHNIKVTSLQKKEELFIIYTDIGERFQATQVIIATGAFHNPFVPFMTEIDKKIQQFHASSYQNPTKIQGEKVLIVGAGNTGVQIAAELSMTHEVILAKSKRLKVLPKTIYGKNLFWWFERIGISKVKATSSLGKWLRRNDPIIGKDIKFVKQNAKITARLVGVDGKAAFFSNGEQEEIDVIIWATGYRNNYNWIQIHELTDQQGVPIQNQGVTNVKGLYFLGLSWQSKRGSALIHGVGEDAEYIISNYIK
ncbi:NAD(P)/FAD-dependent oxidoreductase [Alkalihalobacillus oceani]|uniref:NAD(P)/FAD-dependent oxidoreductase n=1 Tax=Halalkalibacter oceani TaxID=1653776 RepID=A0A9X2DTZ5_9BACI|nr:NAD(P)/FAD-dependent oxidoreductase [Halalkalibacter oceani]MCM3715467.1 NAD(P)/FAD-dependent oxidoreductase [Halalkalibacter oceani]